MKIILLRTNLLEVLGSVERAIGENPNLPILKNFLIKVSGGKVVFTSTNLEIAVQCETYGKVIEDGEITIPFSIFNSVVRNLNSERVTVEGGKGKILVSADNYEGVIQDEDPKEFPIIPTVNDRNRKMKIKTDNLKEALKNSSIAVQYSTIRPEISGVFINQSDRGLIFVGTDSFRLSEITISEGAFSSNMDNLSLIVPIHTVQEIQGMFVGVEEISLFADDNQILFESDKERIISRVIDGTFPDYRAIIPKSFKTEIAVDREEFINAVKLVGAFAGKANDVKLKTGENGKFLEIFSSDTALGESKYKIPARVKGDDLSVIFNWKYLMDGLRIYRSDEVILSTNSADKPALISGTKEKNATYVVMPIRG